jgi:hypothetical protein
LCCKALQTIWGGIGSRLGFFRYACDPSLLPCNSALQHKIASLLQIGKSMLRSAPGRLEAMMWKNARAGVYSPVLR